MDLQILATIFALSVCIFLLIVVTKKVFSFIFEKVFHKKKEECSAVSISFPRLKITAEEVEVMPKNWVCNEMPNIHSMKNLNCGCMWDSRQPFYKSKFCFQTGLKCNGMEQKEKEGTDGTD